MILKNKIFIKNSKASPIAKTIPCTKKNGGSRDTDQVLDVSGVGAIVKRSIDTVLKGTPLCEIAVMGDMLNDERTSLFCEMHEVDILIASVNNFSTVKLASAQAHIKSRNLSHPNVLPYYGSSGYTNWL